MLKRTSLRASVLLAVFGIYLCRRQPNIVLIITDDQDSALGGMIPMKFSRQFFSRSSVSFENAFVSTPVCCPSRASMLTGRYQHNTGVLNNSVSGNCCGADWRAGAERHTAAVHLQRAGYSTFYAGKYLNQYGRRIAGGVDHVPPGWDWWIGLVGNSRYYNYTLSVNGTAHRHRDSYPRDYLTDVLGRHALEFLRGRVDGGAPFLLTVSVPAPHSPHTPAPQYRTRFSNRRAPRTVNFNTPAQDKHSLVGEPPVPLPADVVATIDEDFRNRWRSLLSVDDLLVNLTRALRTQQLLNNTYVILTSDHGYHLGQFGMPVDKRQPYEFDLRAPLLVRSPPSQLVDPPLPSPVVDGTPSRVVRVPVSAVDLAPTLLDMAGIPPADDMDGMSMMPLIGGDWPSAVVSPTSTGLLPTTFRSTLLVSYHGEYGDAVDDACTFRGVNVSNCYVQYACKCQDNRENTYSCLRQMSSELNRIVCYFPLQDFWEVYDLWADPDQLRNMAPTTSQEQLEAWKVRLYRAVRCRGSSCRSI